jgi:hypothetical protein
MEMISIEVLKGQIIEKIDGLERGSDEVVFTLADKSQYRMYHYQDCCEGVSVEDVIGDVDDLIGRKILIAEERTSNENPSGITKQYQDSFTWTFYELATNSGSVTIRWYGESNGYYSEGVDFEKCEDK